MINIFKKLILTLSLIVVVTMGLSKWGPQVTLQADTQAPGTYVYSDFLLGQTKINGSSTSVSGYTSNGYVVAPKDNFFTLNITMPDFRTAIGNWESIDIANSYLKIKALYVGDEMQRSYQEVYAQYGAFAFAQLDAYTNQASPMAVELQSLDANTLPSNIDVEMALLDSRLSMDTFDGLSGEFRIYSIELRINYTYNDEISPLLDGAGSLVASRNLLTFNSITETNYGVTIEYDKTTGIFTFNGTPTQITGFKIATIGNLSGTYRFTRYDISGTKNHTNADEEFFYLRSDADFLTQMPLNRLNASNTTTLISQTYKLIYYMDPDTSYTNYKVKLQLEVGSTATTWMHPDSIYYSTASIQHDQAPDSVTTIMSNVYAYDDVDGNITDRFQVVDTAREYAAILANKWKLNVNEVLSSYDSNTLSEVITNTITLTKAYVDTEFATYQLNTYWYALANDILVPYNLVTPYKFMAYVGDDAGNYSFLEISVFVNDATAPTFSESNPLSIQVSYKTTYDLASWASNLIITDNVDLDVSRSIYTDNYTANKSTPGTYTVIVRAVDDTGNIKDKTYNFVVIDDIVPVFNGPESIFKPQSSTMTISDIKSRYTAYDEISGNVTARITIFEDGYTGRGHLVGTYTVIFRVTDLVGNYTDVTVLVTVSDNIPPVIYVADGYFIQVSSAYTLTIEGIRDILVATGRLNIVSATTYQVIVNEYEGNENLPGIYTISIRFSQTSGVTEVHSVAVNVKNASTLPDGVFNPSSGGDVFIYLGIGIGVIVLFVIFRKKH